jgi:hypothetical protein
MSSGLELLSKPSVGNQTVETSDLSSSIPSLTSGYSSCDLIDEVEQDEEDSDGRQLRSRRDNDRNSRGPNFKQRLDNHRRSKSVPRINFLTMMKPISPSSSCNIHSFVVAPENPSVVPITNSIQSHIEESYDCKETYSKKVIHFI